MAILALHGRLTVCAAETESPPLCTAIGEQIAEGRVRVALDLANMSYIDARGLGELVTAFTTLRRSGGQLTLIAPSVWVRQLLAVTRLDTVFVVRRGARLHSGRGSDASAGHALGDDVAQAFCMSAWS